MRKAILTVTVIFAIFICGCSDINHAATEGTLSPENTPHSMTYNGKTTHWRYELPMVMDFPNGSVTVHSIYFGETATDIGYSLIMQIRMDLPDDISEQELHWLLQEDLQGFGYITDEDGETEKSFSFCKYPDNLSAVYRGLTYKLYDKAIYFRQVVFDNVRYPVAGKTIKLIMSYSHDGVECSYVYEQEITEDILAQYKPDGTVIAVGDSAAAFIGDLATVAGVGDSK